MSDADAEVKRPSDDLPADSGEVAATGPDAAPSPEPGMDEEATGGAETGEPSAVPLAERLEAAEAEAGRRRDDWLRALAEIENLRKRSARELDEQTRRARELVLADLLTIVDDVERAIEAMTQDGAATEDAAGADEEAGESVEGVREGVRLIHSRLLEVLHRYDVKPMDCLGGAFDPHLHEAVMQEPSDAHDSDHVTRILQKGYWIGERVLRPARVAVSP